MGFESNIDNVFKELTNWEEKALDAIGLFGTAEAKLRCPVGKYYNGQVGGNLRSSIGFVTDNKKKSVHVGTNVEYALPVEKGTAPHLILPKNAKMLSWVGKDGKRVFAKKVNHKGTRAQPFLTPAIEGNGKQIQKIIEKIRFP